MVLFTVYLEHQRKLFLCSSPASVNAEHDRSSFLPPARTNLPGWWHRTAHGSNGQALGPGSSLLPSRSCLAANLPAVLGGPPLGISRKPLHLHPGPFQAPARAGSCPRTEARGHQSGEGQGVSWPSPLLFRGEVSHSTPKGTFHSLSGPTPSMSAQMPRAAAARTESPPSRVVGVGGQEGPKLHKRS